MCSSTATTPSVSAPTVSRPGPAACGARPAATSTSSAVTVLPSVMVTVTLSPLAPYGRRPLPGADVHALLGERLADLGTDEVLLARQQPPVTLNQGDPRAKGTVGLAHLDADHPAADHDQRRGNLLGRRRLPVGPGLRVRQPIDVGQHGSGAPGQDHRLAGLQDL